MKILFKYVVPVALLLFMGGETTLAACNNPNGGTLEIAGPKYVQKGKSAIYTLIGVSGHGAGSYSWDFGSKFTAVSDTDNSTIELLASTVSENAGDASISCTFNSLCGSTTATIFEITDSETDKFHYSSDHDYYRVGTLRFSYRPMNIPVSLQTTSDLGPITKYGEDNRPGYYYVSSIVVESEDGGEFKASASLSIGDAVVWDDEARGRPDWGSPPVTHSTYSLYGTRRYNDRTGSEGSKISISGMPLPDVMPGREGETDYTPEKTYVDALTLDLHHDVSDVYVPFASGQLALSVRRTLVQATDSDPSWSVTNWFSTNPKFDPSPAKVDNGLPVEEEEAEAPELPPIKYAFGPCWRSSLDCRLQVLTSYSYDSERNVKSLDTGYSLIYEVIDENGQSTRFAKAWDGSFVPLVSTASGTDVDNISLVDTGTNYVFTRRYGTEITFDRRPGSTEGCPEIRRISTNAIVIGNTTFTYDTNSSCVVASVGTEAVIVNRSITDGGDYVVTCAEPSSKTEKVGKRKSYERREYYAPQQVEDRYGNRLVYGAGQITALYAGQTNSDLTLTILGEMGLVRSITDPEGHVTIYSYDDFPVFDDAGAAYCGTGVDTVITTNVSPESGFVSKSQTQTLTTGSTARTISLLRSISGSGRTVQYEYFSQAFRMQTSEYSSSWVTSGVDAGENSTSSSTNCIWGSSGRDYIHTVLSAVTDENENRINFEWTPTQGGNEQYWLKRDWIGHDDFPPLDFGELPSNGVWVADTNCATHPFKISNIVRGDKSWSNSWSCGFSDPVVILSQDRPTLGVMGNEFMSACPSYDRLYRKLSVTGGGEFTFNFAGLTLSGYRDQSGNSSRWEYTNAHDSGLPTAWINANDDVRSYTYETNFNQKASVVDALGRITKFQFDALGNRTNATQYATNGTTVLSVTEMEYTNSAIRNFMTRKTIVDLDWTNDLVTAYEPHKYGKVGREIVDPGGLNLVTVYDYDKNNNLIYVKDPNGNVTTNGYDALNRLVTIAFFDGASTLKCTKKFWYDPRGNKTWEKDENDHYTFYQYDVFNNCTNTVRIMSESVAEPASGTNIYACTTNDIITVSEYNDLGWLTATVDPRGLRTKFQYDGLGRLTNTVVGANLPVEQQQTTSYAYGENSGSGLFVSEKWSPTSVIDPRGYVTETDYDALYRPVEVRAQVDTTGTVAVTRNLYDDVGNLLMVSNKVNSTDWQVTETLYDDLNRPVTVINPDSTSNTVVYTSTGLKWKVIDEAGRVSEVQYDAAGRPVKTLSPQLADSTQAVIETGYDANGNVRWVKDARFNVTTNVYDYRNRLTQTLAPAVQDWSRGGVWTNPVVTTVYDLAGNVLSVTDAEGSTTTNVYDAANRLVVTIAPEVSVYVPGSTPDTRHPVTTNFYDHAGNITATRDANGRVVQMQYDALGRLTNTVDAVTNTISFEYDANDNQTALIDGNGRRTGFVYDGLNRKTSTVYPDTNHEDAVYDLLGNRIRRIDCNGAVTRYLYDARNRLDLVQYGSDASNPTRTRDYQYDVVGNLTNVVESADSSANVSYTYDALNRVQTETSVGVTHTYRYDLNGNRTNAVYGVTGRSASWTYDALNRISAISEFSPNNQSQITNNTVYGYDLNSRPVYRRYPTGVEEARTFDPMGRLLVMTTTNAVNGESFDMDYRYDAVGSALEMVQSSWNLAGKAQDALTQWSYDARYRLTNETVTTYSQSTNPPIQHSTSYAWDAADNRLSKTVAVAGGGDPGSVSTVSYTNNALNQITGYVEISGGSGSTSTVTFAYDANGSRTNKTETVSTTSTVSTNLTAYTYDEDNRLTGVSQSTSNLPPSTSVFAYDYRSRRYCRATPAETNLCVFDGGLSIQEYDLSDPNNQSPITDNLRTEYVRGEGMGGGVGGMVYSLKHENGNVKLVASHSNHRGDIIARDENGSLTSFALYEAYGTRPHEWSDGVTGDPDRQKANTKEEESDLGLLNEGMRYRDLETGTFLTRDPIGFKDGPNQYCYVHCNPITHFDAFGLTDTGDAIVDWFYQQALDADDGSGSWDLIDTVAVVGAGATKFVDGVIEFPRTVKDQAFNFCSSPSLATIPFVGPAGEHLGNAGSALMDNPKDPIAIVDMVAAASEATAVTMAPLVVKGGGGSSAKTLENSSVAETMESTATPIKSNLNRNDAISNFGLYEIETPAGLEKVGKADLTRVTKSSGLPTRLHQQVRALEKVHGQGNVKGTVVENLGETTTAAAKAAETARITAIVEETGQVPPGNQKSYKP